jgi:DNA polymerase-4
LRIFNEVGLTASAGISVNKFVIASDYNKPNGQKTVNRGCNCFFGRITIRKFYGVGKVTTEKVSIGIFTGVELKVKSVEFWRNIWKIRVLLRRSKEFIIRGQVDRITKSVAAEHTFLKSFFRDLHDGAVRKYCNTLEKRLRNIVFQAKRLL